MKEYIFARPDEAEDTAKRDAYCRGELIRCKECKYYGSAQINNMVSLTNFCFRYNDCRREDDFCSRAERKDV